MVTKDKLITKLTKLVNINFGIDAPMLNNEWDTDQCAIGFQKKNKSMYIAAYNKNDYFYICEDLVDDLDQAPIFKDSENNITEERVLEVMSKFFEIAKQSSK